MEYFSTNDFQLSFHFEQRRADTLLTKASKLGKEDVVHLLLYAGAAIEATNEVT